MKRPPRYRSHSLASAVCFGLLGGVALSQADDAFALEGGALGGSAVVSSALASSDAALVTFSGLRVYEDGSSTLNVSLTKKTPVTFSQNGKFLTFVLKGAKVELRNNKNPLRAEYFQSNVMRTKLDDAKEGVTLSIELRKPATPEHQMVVHSGGAILRVDIPPPPA